MQGSRSCEVVGERERDPERIGLAVRGRVTVRNNCMWFTLRHQSRIIIPVP